MQGISNENGLVAVLLEDLGQRRLVPGDGLPAPEPYVYALKALPVAEGKDPHARVYSPARQNGGRRLGVGPGKAQALFCEGIEVGRLYPVVAVRSQVIPPQTVQ